MAVGLLCMAVGLVSFFSAFGGSGPPKYFWCCFVGMPLMFVGFAMTSAGYMGAVARYQASEIAPVGKDTFNYLADGTKPGVHAVVSTAAAALREGQADKDQPFERASETCPACNDWNDPDARFCDHCGTALPMKPPTEVACADCQTPNDLNAKFCDACGKPMR